MISKNAKRVLPEPLCIVTVSSQNVSKRYLEVSVVSFSAEYGEHSSKFSHRYSKTLRFRHETTGASVFVLLFHHKFSLVSTSHSPAGELVLA